MAEGSIAQRIVGILHQLEVRASRKISDRQFVLVEDGEKFLHAGFGEMHADDTDQHIDS